MQLFFSYSLNLWGVSGQSCGQSTGAVFMIIKPANLLSQHGLETQTPQSTSQQLPRCRERIALRKRMINAANSEELTNTICTCFWTSLKILTHLQHLCEKRNHTNEHKEQTDAINFSPLLNRIGHRESLQVETQVVTHTGDTCKTERCREQNVSIPPGSDWREENTPGSPLRSQLLRYFQTACRAIQGGYISVYGPRVLAPPVLRHHREACSVYTQTCM